MVQSYTHGREREREGGFTSLCIDPEVTATQTDFNMCQLGFSPSSCSKDKRNTSKQYWKNTDKQILIIFFIHLMCQEQKHTKSFTSKSQYVTGTQLKNTKYLVHNMEINHRIFSYFNLIPLNWAVFAWPDMQGSVCMRVCVCMCVCVHACMYVCICVFILNDYKTTTKGDVHVKTVTKKHQSIGIKSSMCWQKQNVVLDRKVTSEDSLNLHFSLFSYHQLLKCSDHYTTSWHENRPSLCTR